LSAIDTVNWMNNINQDNKITLQSGSEQSIEEVSIKKETTAVSSTNDQPKEIGGRTQGLEPTRYGDWEFKGRCIDF